VSSTVIDLIRARFPALSPDGDGRAPIFLDNPGGTQVPQVVVDAVSDCLIRKNANLGGLFPTSELAGAMVSEAHEAMADFVNARSSREIVFGQNMTTLTLHMSRSLGRLFSPGDEIIITRMEHDANVSPWLLMARDHGLEVKYLPFDLDSFEFDLARLDDLLSPRTRLLCFNHASNLTGTVNPVKAATAKAHAAGALVYVDSVQYAPHGVIDVQDLDCDFLVCSPYKFYGPHMGVLWGKEERLSELDPYKLRAAGDGLPDRFETGTLNHEGMAGVTAVIEHFTWIGRDLAPEADRLRHDGFTGRRLYLRTAMDFLGDLERPLTQQLIDGLRAMKGVRIHGITNPNAGHRRVPTVSLSVAGREPGPIAQALGEQGFQVWNGHNYALDPVRELGLLEKSGVLRIGLAQYNTRSEVDQVLSALETVVAGNR
jgi:cysteine desulfurase family protein (TIGR01976 family)